jgi:hypothetical protein
VPAPAPVAEAKADPKKEEKKVEAKEEKPAAKKEEKADGKKEEKAEAKKDEKKDEKKDDKKKDDAPKPPLLPPAYKLLPVGVFGIFAVIALILVGISMSMKKANLDDDDLSGGAAPSASTAPATGAHK